MRTNRCPKFAECLSTVFSSIFGLSWQGILINRRLTGRHHNHANVVGQSFQWDLKWLCVLLNEADVMASASAKYGPDLGESLALEWRTIDFPNHSTVARLEGRKNFLKQLIFSSPSSLVLGMKEKIFDEIQLMN